MIESEKKLERNLKNKISKSGGYCLKMTITGYSGFPDRMCLLPGGILFFAEIKTTKKKLSPLQKVWFNTLVKLGFKVYKIDTTESLNSILKYYKL